MKKTEEEKILFFVENTTKWTAEIEIKEWGQSVKNLKNKLIEEEKKLNFWKEILKRHKN